MLRRSAWLFVVVSLAGPFAAAGATTVPLASPHLRGWRVTGVKTFSSPGAPQWTPGSLAAAYGFTWSPTNGSGTTIAIVDAYDAPTAEADLNAFSTQFALPACTSANGCFTKVNQNGAASPLPTYNADWAPEIALDVQWAHAIAPAAKILLVEARTAQWSDLLIAERYANVRSSAAYISNSWGASEFSSERNYDAYFTPAPGKTIFVAAGDTGLPAEYPSSAPNVVSVGGTSLTVSAGVVNETVWANSRSSSGGGGCSKYERASSAQGSFSQYAQAGCKGMRATPDLSAVADPYTGVLVDVQGSWWQFGGTSLASPVVAAIAATTRNALNAPQIYGNAYRWRDANAGARTNGATCRPGYDLCTGRGSLINITTSR